VSRGCSSPSVGNLVGEAASLRYFNNGFNSFDVTQGSADLNEDKVDANLNLGLGTETRHERVVDLTASPGLSNKIRHFIARLL